MYAYHRSGKRISDPLELELWVSTQTLRGCCKLNLGPLQEQSVFSLLNLSIPAPCFLRQGLSLNAGAHRELEWLSCKIQGSSCLCSPTPQCWEYRCVSPRPGFFFFFLNTGSEDDEVQVAAPSGQTLSQPSHALTVAFKSGTGKGSSE